MLLNVLLKEGVIHPPNWLIDNTVYLTMMGSHAYGTNTAASDVDIYGVCVPLKHIVFPHLAGEIEGFGRQKKRFEQWLEAGITNPSTKIQYDFQVYNIVKYFSLAMENNPNMLDSLFTARDCVLHSTTVGEMIHVNRHIFLHKGLWHKFKGYAYSQMQKMNSIERTGKRKAIYDEFGFDVKFAMHLVRLIGEAEQMMTTGDLDLRLNREHLKAIRRGEVKESEIREWFAIKEKDLEKLYHSTDKLPYAPDEAKIKQLLLDCLEHHYGSLAEAISVEVTVPMVLDKMTEVINQFSRQSR